MKNTILFFVFAVFCNLSVSSQGNRVISISPDMMNVLYIGVDNPLTIAVAGVDVKNINVRINNGSIIKVSPGKYIARVKPHVSQAQNT